MTSIKDVAKRAGVAVGTVSRVLNKSRHVTAATRRRVQNVISDLEYKPNQSARALRSKRTHLIALSLPELTNPFYAAIIEGVQRELNRRDFQLILCTPRTDLDIEPKLIEMLVDHHVDGLILESQRFSPANKNIKELINLGRKGYPIVSLAHSMAPESPAFDSIVTDISIGMREAMMHLLQLGHRKISYFGPPKGVVEVRLKLFRKVLAEHEIKADESLIFHVEPTVENGFRLAERVLERRHRPTAIMAVNDMVAIGAMMALQEHKIDLPSEMSIIGIDDLPFASVLHPKLTTVQQPKDELGSLAAKRLLGRINKEISNFQVISLSSRLIVRESTASPLSSQALERQRALHTVQSSASSQPLVRLRSEYV